MNTKEIEIRKKLEDLENQKLLLQRQEEAVKNFLILLRQKYLNKKKEKEKEIVILKDKKKINMMEIREIKKQLKLSSSDVKHLFDFYSIKFKEAYGSYPMIDYAVEGNLLKKILSIYNKKQVEFFIQEYVQMDDKFIKESGYRLRFLPSVINKLLTKYYKVNAISDNSNIQKLKAKEIERLSGKLNDEK